MPVVASPNYYNPQMGQVAQNLGVALFGDPEARMKRDYYDSEVQKNRAGAGKLDAETAFQLGRNQAQQHVQDAIQSGALVRQPGESDLQYMTRAQGYLSAIGGLATTAKDASDAVSGGLASLYGTSGTEQGAHTSLTLQGKTMGVNDYGTVEGQQAGQARDIAGKANVAQIGANAEVQKQRIHEGGETERFVMTPRNAGAGDTIYVPKALQEKTGLGPTLYGMPTEATAKGAAGTRISAGQGTPGDATLWERTRQGGGPAEVDKGDIDKIEALAGQRIKGGLDAPKGKGALPLLNKEFLASLPPGARERAQTLAAQDFAQHKDQQRAANVYYYALFPGTGGGGAPAADAPAASGPAPAKVPMLNGQRIYPSPDGRGWVYGNGSPAQ